MIMELIVFSFFEEDKILHIIQNKYYQEETSLDRKHISDFLQAPLTILESGKYKGDYAKRMLQEYYNKTQTQNENETNDWQIYLHFFITHAKNQNNHKILFDDFNKKNKSNHCLLSAKIHYLEDIFELYYGKSYEEGKKFEANITTESSETYLKIDPKEKTGMVNMNKSYYVMTPVYELYDIYEKANREKYPLFAENIREYLGKNPVNKDIIKTLSSDEKQNFFYYNNGITILCEKVDEVPNAENILTMENPQIVNGCQTVNSIKEALDDFNKTDIRNSFKQCFVMVKILENQNDKGNDNFYRNVIRYTNRQNAINEKTFGASNDPFYQIQGQLEDRGILLLVKQSDKYSYQEKYNDKKTGKTNEQQLLEKSKANLLLLGDNKTLKISDIKIDIEKYLLIIGAFVRDGYFAFMKKSQLLNPSTDLYSNFSTQIQNQITVNNAIKLFSLFKKSEQERKESDNKTLPIPYYVLSFFGYCAKEEIDNTDNSLNDFLSDINAQQLQDIFDFCSSVSEGYYHQFHTEKDKEYNAMIKTFIDINILNAAIRNFFTYNKKQAEKLAIIFPRTYEKYGKN